MMTMTWDETIDHIRNQPEFATLVDQAYFEADLNLNVERYRNRDEYRLILAFIQQYAASAKHILDIGSGNGITAVNFARDGFKVEAVEPDTSNSIGSGAIDLLKERYNLSNLHVVNAFAEKMPFDTGQFDVVFVRQAMHHAHNLTDFIKECTRVLKPGGLFFTVRDHVIYNDKDKAWFLDSHPLHKFYGGENAFTKKEYEDAMYSSGLEIKQVLKHYDSPINYFPLSEEEYNRKPGEIKKELLQRLQKKVGFFYRFPVLQKWYFKRNGFIENAVWDETKIPGRMYSFLATKPLS